MKRRSMNLIAALLALVVVFGAVTVLVRHFRMRETQPPPGSLLVYDKSLSPPVQAGAPHIAARAWHTKDGAVSRS